MKNALIINGGDNTTERDQIGEFDFVVAVDSGAEHAYKLFLKPDLVIGDLDSIDEKTYQRVIKDNIEIKEYKEYKDKNFIVVGFPSNNFLWQEPGTNDQIAEFCKENYGVSFPMMSKVSVKGSSMHPLYKFLTKKSQNGKLDSSVSWNFQKFLIDEDGFVVRSVSPRTKPDDQSIIDWIKS